MKKLYKDYYYDLKEGLKKSIFFLIMIKKWGVGVSLPPPTAFY